MAIDFNELRDRFRKGDHAGVKRALVDRLAADPNWSGTWDRLVEFYPDPIEQADCCRQILNIDPTNQQAADRLLAVTNQLWDSQASEGHGPVEGDSLECKQCGAQMEIHHLGELRDKRAMCAYCGGEIDLPDSYQGLRKTTEREKLPAGVRSVEKTVNEARSDSQLTQEDLESMPPEVQELLDQVGNDSLNVIDETFLKKLQSVGINISVNPDAVDPATLDYLKGLGCEEYSGPSLSNTTKTVFTRYHFLERPFGNLPFQLRSHHDRQQSLFNAHEIFSMLGPPPPPETLFECPNQRCGAVIPKKSTQCPWCGEAIPKGD
jgi:hypothetical protein